MRYSTTAQDCDLRTFNRPRRGSNSMTTTNTFTATCSTGSRTVATGKRPVGASMKIAGVGAFSRTYRLPGGMSTAKRRSKIQSQKPSPFWLPVPCSHACPSMASWRLCVRAPTLPWLGLSLCILHSAFFTSVPCSPACPPLAGSTFRPNSDPRRSIPRQCRGLVAGSPFPPFTPCRMVVPPAFHGHCEINNAVSHFT